MRWLSDFTAWLVSDRAQPVLFTGIVLALAVIIAGLIAAWISRGAVSAVLTHTRRQQKAAAIATLVDAATEASVWHSLTPQEQVLSDRAVGQADTIVRLLPIRGAATAANWATHQLAQLKRNSATYGSQLDPGVAELRDRLIEWQYHPRRIRKTFQEDLDRWSFEYEATRQDREAAEQVTREQRAAAGSAAAQDARQPDAVPGRQPGDAAASELTPDDLVAEGLVPGELASEGRAMQEANPGMLPTGPEAD